MKYIAFIILFSGSAIAQSITGVPVLKGTLKTKVNFHGVSATCKVKVIKLKNIMEEDAFGFPGYQVRIEADLNGRNENGESVVSFDREFMVTNFWNVNGKTVAKDFEYFSEDGALLTIKEDGRLKSFVFPVQNEKVTCAF
jgi:acyl-coenzyme A synthetase/AMP-(fatty) acid ligase